MAGYKIKLNNEEFVGFNKNDLIRTNIENAHIYHSVLSAETIINFMNKQGDFIENDVPTIVDKYGETIKIVQLARIYVKRY